MSEREVSPFHEAINRKSLEDLETLISQDACNIECVNKNGQTPLLHAVKNNFEAGVDLLLTKGANVNALDHKGSNSLFYALINSNERVVESLIMKGANVHYANNLKVTSLHTAAFVPFSKGVSLLLKAGAKVNVKDDKGNTPLHISAKTGSYTIVKALLAAGAEIDCKNNNGETSLHIAVDTDHESVVEFLLKSGADVKVRDRYGETPLYRAIGRVNDNHVCRESAFITHQLLDWGSSLYTETCRGESSLAYALEEDSTKKVIHNYAVKLKCADLLFDTNMDVVSSMCFSSYQLECLRELETIKSTKFGRHSMYCVFSKCSCYFLNTEMEQAIWSPDLESNFPIYGSLLLATFATAKKRRDLLDSAQHSLTVLLQASEIVKDISLPDVIIENILSFINNDDLMILIKNFSVIDIA